MGSCVSALAGGNSPGLFACRGVTFRTSRHSLVSLIPNLPRFPRMSTRQDRKPRKNYHQGMGLDPNDGRKPSVQVAEAIKRDILAGRWAPGGQIPSAPELARELEVAKQTVTNGIKLLQDEGYVVARVGSGTFVRTDFAQATTGPTLSDLAKTVDEVQAKLRVVDESEAPVDIGAFQRLQDEVAQLRREVATLQTQLIDLYGRTGNPYPRSTTESRSTGSARRAG
jgi:DNA-binding transcriptional regulator YhcF (GntR family)